MAALAAIAAPITVIYGQSLSESVTVEGRFTPEIIPADRLALLPAAMTLTAPESPMTYDRKGTVAAFAPDALSMPATGWRARQTPDTSRGYIDLRLGSWLNSSLSAGYTALNTADTRLNAYFQHNSTSLWQAWRGSADGIPGADRRFRYDETLGADFYHHIAGAGKLDAALQYHFGSFNYYGTDQGEVKDGRIQAPRQVLNDLYASVAWTGEGLGRFSYGAHADVRHFAYRDMYAPLYTAQYPRRYARTRGERETVVNVGGDVRYSLSDGSGNRSSVGIGLLYTGVVNAVGNDVNRLEATPAYTLAGKGYTLRLGANIAVVGNGESTRLRLAPDVRFSVRKGMAVFSAEVGGGTRLRTLAWRHQMDYYSIPGLGCYRAAYSPLDIRMALQFNPGGRFTAGAEAVWTSTLDESFGGLYQAMLNQNREAYGSYPASGRLHGYSIAINAGYEFCRYLTLKGKGSWQPQDGSKGILNGFDRPELTADLIAESRPTDALSLRLGYHLRARRELLPGSLSRLGLEADYRLTDRISIGLQLDNLLNRHEEFLPGLQLEGFNAMGGVQVVF